MFQGLRELRGPHGPYVEFNPWQNIRVKSYATTANQDSALNDKTPEYAAENEHYHPDEELSPTERVIEAEEWDFLKHAVESMPKETRRGLANYQRNRWLLSLLYYAFLRRKEASMLGMQDSSSATAIGGSMSGSGKGGKARTVSAPSKLMEALGNYREFYGLPRMPSQSESIPALLPLYWQPGKPAEPLTAQVVYVTIRTLCRYARTTQTLDPDSDLARKLDIISPHWTRHTGISHALERGSDARTVQNQAGHASHEYNIHVRPQRKRSLGRGD